MSNLDSPPVVHGYHGQYLHIDVSGPAVAREPLAAHVLRRLLGGSGLGTYLVLRHGAAAGDALRPAAALVFAFSPLVGSPITTSAKLAVVSKSPLTERINDSLMSGAWAMAGKRCGCDAIVIQGRAAALSVLVIDDGSVRLDPARAIAGATCEETSRWLAARYGAHFESAVIGPAGERLVHYATLSHAGRHAGRGGTGAVLGSKNLKAILVRGTRSTTSAHPARLAQLARRLVTASVGPGTAKYRELGTVANLPVLNRLHALPVRNFQQGSIGGTEAWTPETLAHTHLHRRSSCVACTIGCTHGYSVRSESRGAETIARTEYENLFALGPLCGVEDPDAALRASHRCDQLGIDTISAGGTIAFAMECAERGVLDVPWLRFGSADAVLRSLDLIGSRDGLGDQLARGSRWLARRLGAGTLSFAPQVKGLELPGYEPRAMQTLALGLAVGSRGADHNRSGAAEADFSTDVDRRHLVADAARAAVQTEDTAALLDSLILCRFLRKSLGDVFPAAAEMLRLVTGWDVDARELESSAARIVTLKKLFNIRAGWTPAEDTLPDRFLEQVLPDDSMARLDRQQLAAAVQAYNLARGWSADGGIDPNTLDRWQLVGIWDELNARSAHVSFS